MEAAHRHFRERIGSTRAAPTRTQETMREVLFSACRDHEVAFETAGHGDFTVRATRILAGGVGGLTHEGFQQRVNGAFGDGARQHPELDCAPAARTRNLLEPLVAAPATGPATNGRGAAPSTPSSATLAQALRTLANALSPAP
jgi:hypothetical protein